jgi:hypothetical protein
MSNDNMQVQNVLVPVEQVEIPFYGHTLVAVRLEDGQIAAVLRWLCDGLQLDMSGQLQRIQRKTALAEGLLTVQVRTEGGPQTMPALTLDVLPGCLFTIDENRVNKAARPDVIVFQRLCVKVLAEHFAQKQPQQPTPLALPSPTVVTPTEPPSIAPHASADERRLWRQMMRANGWIAWTR